MYDPFYNTGGAPFPPYPPMQQPMQPPLWMQQQPMYFSMPFPGPFSSPDFSNSQSFQNLQNFGEEINSYPPQDFSPPQPDFSGYYPTY